MSDKYVLAGCEEAISYLLISETDYKKLEMYQTLLDVQYLIAVVYHNLGMIRERNEAAERHIETQAQQRKLEAVITEDEIQEIFKVISLVGAALAGR